MISMTSKKNDEMKQAINDLEGRNMDVLVDAIFKTK